MGVLVEGGGGAKRRPKHPCFLSVIHLLESLFLVSCMERQAFSPSIGAICSDRTFWNVSTYNKITQVGEALGVNPAPSSIEQLADFLSKNVEEGRTVRGESAACRLLPLFWCGFGAVCRCFGSASGGSSSSWIILFSHCCDGHGPLLVFCGVGVLGVFLLLDSHV